MSSFTVGVSHTINLGHYESTRIEASITLDVETEDIASKVVWQGWREYAQDKLGELLSDTIRDHPHSATRAMLARVYTEKAEQERLENERHSESNEYSTR
jgi:hypothetical protein